MIGRCILFFSLFVVTLALITSCPGVEKTYAYDVSTDPSKCQCEEIVTADATEQNALIGVGYVEGTCPKNTNLVGSCLYATNLGAVKTDTLFYYKPNYPDSASGQTACLLISGTWTNYP